MNHAEICPVCKGTGQFREYNDYAFYTYIQSTCHGCSGKGWITVSDSNDIPLKKTATLQLNKDDYKEMNYKEFKQYYNNIMNTEHVDNLIMEDYNKNRNIRKKGKHF